MASIREYQNFISSKKIYNHCIDPKRRIEKRYKYEVKLRDEFKCVKCGKKKRLTVHHIRPYAKFKKIRLSMANGITLCEECHKEFNRLFSKKYNKQGLNELILFIGKKKYTYWKDNCIEYMKEFNKRKGVEIMDKVKKVLKKPMKCVALKDENLDILEYPVICSPKIDGIRSVIIGGKALSSTLKPIGNEYIRQCLNEECYEFLDGELVVGDPKNKNSFTDNTTGAVRRKKGEPDFKFYVFDSFWNKELGYEKRWLSIMHNFHKLPHIEVLEHKYVYNKEELLQYEKEKLLEGYEGIIVRKPDGRYKEGRTTVKEQIEFKRKPLSDTEGEIIGFIEEMENTNEKKVNELGNSVRSSHQENKKGKGTLGAFIVKSDIFNNEFHLNAKVGEINKMRDEIWNNQEKYLGKIVKFSYQEYGSTDNAPRIPILISFREKWDMTNY